MMSIKSKSTVKFSCRKMPTPKEHELIRKRVNDPYELTGIDGLRAFYELRGLEFDEENFKKIVRDFKPNNNI